MCWATSEGCSSISAASRRKRRTWHHRHAGACASARGGVAGATNNAAGHCSESGVSQGEAHMNSVTAVVRLAVVDDQTLFRTGLTRMLDEDPRVEIVGQAA